MWKGIEFLTKRANVDDAVRNYSLSTAWDIDGDGLISSRSRQAHRIDRVRSFTRERTGQTIRRQHRRRDRHGETAYCAGLCST